MEGEWSVIFEAAQGGALWRRADALLSPLALVSDPLFSGSEPTSAHDLQGGIFSLNLTARRQPETHDIERLRTYSGLPAIQVWACDSESTSFRMWTMDAAGLGWEETCDLAAYPTARAWARHCTDLLRLGDFACLGEFAFWTYPRLFPDAPEQ